MPYNLINADAGKIPVADNTFHCAVTSYPYWQLRDYGVSGQMGNEPLHDCGGWVTGAPCGKCFICHVTAAAQEVRRVLRPDGTFWVNIGDCYNGSGGAGGDYAPGGRRAGQPKYAGRRARGLKQKDLIGIPWRVAFSLQAAGWWLRSEVIWEKPNRLPDPANDRPSVSHEQIFMFTKSAHYFYDWWAVKEEFVETADARIDALRPDNGGRRRRSVWRIPTQMFTGGHFATFPIALPEICIRASSSARGCCPVCGSPWARKLVVAKQIARQWSPANKDGSPYTGKDKSMQNEYQDAGFFPTCQHTEQPIPCRVFDPFIGSGTTIIAARRNGRSGFGVDLSPEYLRLAAGRIEKDAPGIQKMLF